MLSKFDLLRNIVEKKNLDTNIEKLVYDFKQKIENFV